MSAWLPICSECLTQLYCPVGDAGHGGDRIRSLDLNEQCLTTADHVKGVDFGCAAVPASVIDLPLPVPVAQCEVGETGKTWSVGER